MVPPPGGAAPHSQVDHPAAALVGEDVELVEQLRKVSLPQERCSGASSWGGWAGFTGRRGGTSECVCVCPEY